ncbi:MAG: hypothetical protein OEY10_08115, partial [Nitrosopumilus sp.]|nr:hypothetical protein [Nitrosopumilus sp.]
PEPEPGMEIEGGRGDDVLYGGSGNDEIEGGQGADTIYGGAGNDEIEGGQGADTIYGGAGNDEIEGGQGADTIIGGEGDDILEGGKGADTFVFTNNDGDDVILDIAEGDILRFEGDEFSADDFSIQHSDDGATITFGDDSNVSVTLNDVDPGDGYTITQEPGAVVVTFDDETLD